MCYVIIRVRLSWNAWNAFSIVHRGNNLFTEYTILLNLLVAQDIAVNHSKNKEYLKTITIS